MTDRHDAKHETKRETKSGAEQQPAKTPEQVRAEKEAAIAAMPDKLGPSDYSGTRYSPNAPPGEPPTKEQRAIAAAQAGKPVEAEKEH
ncbi:hypothetical protein HAP48_0035130 [Bradyrhizobium septentrionale]|uniref:Uncharacterized protein n=1 Tax=Bradyrhizobium septentrionale TaxID=1404411 RepID=A0A973W0K9_9BRAD|nr:hypothetical protein [Bradyrhizobium septentrionale]UGY13768.1 hypothetical protein HAP48_0035130 [Bradyrhizobium septentrionale]